jgi:hypothetical protein
VHVAIRNGSGRKGEGQKVADTLRKAGFVIDSVGNAASFGYDATEIHVRDNATPLFGERVRTALSLQSAALESDSAPAAAAVAASDVTVIIGRDLVAATTIEASK